ncbi:MAG TPA: glycosyltransferase [Verrucomicrobiota bacterium]|nr:glycosyltransferase [Verrucomicrobiota bacterium]
MKLAVFAHIPPPAHGQSLSIQRMLDGFGGDRAKQSASGPGSATRAGTRSGRRPDIECYHIDARFSRDLEDLGAVRFTKAVVLFKYCAKALWLRFRYGVRALYYVPCPPRRSSLYRDWAILLLCRWAYPSLVFHWHAVGLGEWVENNATGLERAVTHWLFDRADLAVVLSRFNQHDAARFQPRTVEVVANGIADPCPDFAQAIAPRRMARIDARRQLRLGHSLSEPDRARAGGDPERCRVLFLGHCSRDKGVFDAVAGVEAANRQLAAQGSPLRFHLTVIGGYVDADTRIEFERMLEAPGRRECIEYLGRVDDDAKWRAFREADIFCFPTYFAWEGQPANVIEAMAFGLPVVTTRWRAIPELLPENYTGLVEPRSPDQVAAALMNALTENGAPNRMAFEGRFTLERHLDTLATALTKVD